MRAFLEGCFFAIVILIGLSLILGIFIGIFGLVLLSYQSHPDLTLAGLMVSCIFLCGVSNWWDEYNQNKNWTEDEE